MLSFGLTSAAVAAPESAKVAGKVKWGSKITETQKKLGSSAVLYIFARKALEAKGPPLAVKRIAQPFSLPTEFTLSGEDAMMPGMPFEGALKITARISQSGSVMPVSPGDIEGSTKKDVKPGAKGLEVELDSVK